MPDTQLEWIEPAPQPGLGIRERCTQQPFLVITGAPGSGKTRLLAELAAALLRKDNYFLPAQTSPPATHAWRQLALKEVDVNYWAQVWRALILTSVLTFLNHKREHLSLERQADLDAAKQALWPEVFELNYARHPFAVVNIFLRRERSGGDTAKRTFFNHSRWDLIEEVVAHAMREDVPALLLELDHFDNYFTSEPSIMAEIQAGLAVHLVERSRSNLGGGRLRVHATVRHLVPRFIVRNDGPTIQFEDSVVEIKWTKSAIRGALVASLRLLGDGVDGISDLVEENPVEVPLREAREEAEEYLLRHTTLTPRDCRTLVRALVSRPFTRALGLPVEDFRRIVSECSEMMASATVHQLISDLRALGGRTVSGSRRPSAGDVRQEELKNELRRELERVGTDALTWHDLQRLVETWDEATRPYLTDCLWAYRLVGRHLHGEHDDADSILISASILDRLESNYRSLILHPHLLDLCTLTPTKGVLTIEYV